MGLRYLQYRIDGLEDYILKFCEEMEKELDEENNAVSATASQISGTCGENLKWEFKDGTLTISGNGKMDSFNSSYSTPWHYSAKDIKKLIIKQGVISIGNHAFYGCSGLTSITIPSSVTMVANYDSSFLDEFIENSSDLIGKIIGIIPLKQNRREKS